MRGVVGKKTVHAGVCEKFANLINFAELDRTDDEALFVFEGLFKRHLL